MLTRTVADTAHALDMLGGYEVGDANWAPRPAEPYATSMRRDPGRLRIAVTADNPLGVDAAGGRARGVCAAPRSCCAALGHEVVEAAPAFPPAEVLDIFINVFGPAIALGIDSAVRIVGREPERGRDRAAVAGAAGAGARRRPRSPTWARSPQLQALARGLVAFFADYDVLITPALGERPLPIGECHGYGRGPAARPRALRPLHALHVAVQRHRPARDLACPVGLGRDGLPAGVQIVGRPLNEERAAAARGAAGSGATRGRT